MNAVVPHRTPGSDPIIVVFSDDQAVLKIASAAANAPWSVVNCDDPHDARATLTKPGVRLVVIDDAKVDESMRGWLLDRVRRYASRALILYIASSHSAEAERRARASSVHYYTSKPIDPDRTLRVLQSFIRSSV